MDRKNWKAFYLKKGKYKDGRSKIVIAWFEGGLRKILSLPEPEKLRDLLSAQCNSAPNPLIKSPENRAS